MVVGALLLVAAYFFTAFLHGQFFYIFVTFIPYYFMLPTFVMVRSVVAVALCRMLTDMRTFGGHRFSQFSGVTLVRCLVRGLSHHNGVCAACVTSMTSVGAQKAVRWCYVSVNAHLLTFVCGGVQWTRYRPLVSVQHCATPRGHFTW